MVIKNVIESTMHQVYGPTGVRVHSEDQLASLKHCAKDLESVIFAFVGLLLIERLC